MEFIIISESKLKIMLSQKDLDKYNIDGENFSICNDTQRHAFRHVLNDACKQSGFEGNTSRLMVQMYPSKRGGCEIFVTKLDIADQRTRSEQKKRKDTQTIICDPEESGVLCYSFSEFSHLNTVCKQLKQSLYCGTSKAYADRSGAYYLILEPCDCQNASPKQYSALSFIDEFAKRSDPGRAIAYIEEHGKVICREDAVEKIGSL